MTIFTFSGKTSDTVDEAIAVLREQIADARNDLKAAIGHDEKAAHEERILNMLDRLTVVENNRANLMLSAMVGRRSVDKLPEAEIEQVQAQLALVSPPEEPKT